MALVAYDNSDSSEFEDDNDEISSVTSVPQPSKEIILNPSAINLSSDIFKSLLPPSRQRFQPAEEEDDEFLHKKASDIKQKAQIMVPSLKDFKDVKGTARVKPKGTNGKKSGLLSILPDPKNGVKVSVNSLIPHSVSKKANIPPVKMPVKAAPKTEQPIETKPLHNLAADYSDEDSENYDDIDFFSINKKTEIMSEDPSVPKEIVVNKVIGAPDSYISEQAEDYEDVSEENESIAETEGDFIELTDSTNGNNLQLDEEAIRQLCGSRGRRKNEDVQILDINQQQVLDEAREMLMKNIMDESQVKRTSAKRKGNGPTSQQKRKHQITYLAYQAKANEAELQNQWAQNRVSKRQTQSKYGF